MATPTSNQWDDLIIISDDIADTSITATLEPQAATIVTEESPLSFEASNFTADIFSGLDLWSLDTPKKTQTPLALTVEPSVVSTPQTTVTLTEEVSEVVEEESIVEEVAQMNSNEEGDMDGILSETIVRLKKRQEVSRSTRGSKLSQVDSLNQKIAKLKQQVSQLKDEVAQLESEDAKIEANVVALENMKLVSTEVTEADMQPYNQKRVGRSVKKV